MAKLLTGLTDPSAPQVTPAKPICTAAARSEVRSPVGWVETAEKRDELAACRPSRRPRNAAPNGARKREQRPRSLEQDEADPAILDRNPGQHPGTDEVEQVEQPVFSREPAALQPEVGAQYQKRADERHHLGDHA